MSANILRQLGASGGPFMSGFPWQAAGQIQRFSVDSLASKILCQRHNSDLSDLDTLAGHLFSHIEKINAEFTAGQLNNWLWFVNGQDIERWLLKTICGILAAKVARSASGDLMTPNWSSNWMNVLFHGHSFFFLSGLFMNGDVAKSLDSSRPLSFGPVHWGSDVVGIAVGFHGLEFKLSTAIVDRTKATGAITPASLYRPAYVSVEHQGCQKVIYFHWDEWTEHAGIHIAWQPSADPSALSDKVTP